MKAARGYAGSGPPVERALTALGEMEEEADNGLSAPLFLTFRLGLCGDGDAPAIMLDSKEGRMALGEGVFGPA